MSLLGISRDPEEEKEKRDAGRFGRIANQLGKLVPGNDRSDARSVSDAASNGPSFHNQN